MIAGALWLIGVPSPIAWGILAGLMRFVPYVGAYIAAALPLLIAAAIDPGWTTFLWVLALFVVGEMTMGQAVEPQVFGHGTGVTPIALITATIFWTWLWGPLGLLLATPMTVVLAVLGRHVEGLEFFDVLLGDTPALTPQQRFYQRALTGDAAEATYHAELGLKDESLASYLDTVALSGLKLAERDASRGGLDDAQAERVAATVKEMLDNLADFEPHRWFAKLRRKPDNGKTDTGKTDAAKTDKEEDSGSLATLAAAEEEQDKAFPVVERSELAPGWVVDEPILCIGGRSPLDEAAADILAEVLKKRGLGAKALDPDAISAGHIASLAKTEAKLVCLSYLGLGAGPALIRYVVRRLRRIMPQGTAIVVCYWHDEGNKAAIKAMLETAEADGYATTLPEAVELCVKAAKGELASEHADASAPPPPATRPSAARLNVNLRAPSREIVGGHQRGDDLGDLGPAGDRRLDVVGVVRIGVDDQPQIDHRQAAGERRARDDVVEQAQAGGRDLARGRDRDSAPRRRCRPRPAACAPARRRAWRRSSWRRPP